MSTNNLLDILDNLEKILVKYSIDDWAQTIEWHKERLKAAGTSGSVKWMQDELETIQGLYGGMGSFNDINITTEDYRGARPEDVTDINNIFQGLKGQLYRELENELRTLKRHQPTK
jgi:hypothetical protein